MTKNNLPAWDLSDLYQGIDDPKINKDIKDYNKHAAAFEKKYKGKLSLIPAETFAHALKELENMTSLALKLGGFASLNMSTQLNNPQATAFYQYVQEAFTAAEQHLVFFSLELAHIDEARISTLLKNKAVAHYKPFIERRRKYRKYLLSEELESLLLDKSLTSENFIFFCSIFFFCSAFGQPIKYKSLFRVSLGKG